MKISKSTFLKLFFLLLGITIIPSEFNFCQAQYWTTSGNAISGSSFFGTTNNEPLIFKANSHVAMVILGNGNVGIGTSDPNYPFQIDGDMVDSGTIYTTNLEVSHNLSIGQFKMVHGVIDSIISTSGSLQLSATVVNSDGAITAAQMVTAGNGDSAITLDGDAGTITSPIKTISFGDDTITTTAAIRARNFISANDTLVMPVIESHRLALFPGDSLIRFGDSSIIMNLVNNNIYSYVGHSSCCPPHISNWYGGIALGTSNTLLGSNQFSALSLAVGNYNNVNGGIAIGTGNSLTGGISIGSTNILSGGGFMTIGAGLTNTINGAILIGNSISNKPAISIIPDPSGSTAGKVGIGTTTPACELDVEGAPATSTALLVGSGAVVIGSGVATPGSYGLYVGNGILTSLVKVAITNGSNWSDYVFKPTYKLKPLNELAIYIQENKHLPDVPSVEDVQKNGINVAEMDATLLKKVEELTLYILQQQKEIEELNKKISTMTKQK